MRRLAAPTLASCLTFPLWAQAGLHWEKPDPKPATQATDAISQLEAMTGQKIDRSKVKTTFKVRQPAPRPKVATRPTLSTNQQIGLSLAGSLIGGLFSAAFQPAGPAGPSPAELAALEAARQAELQREQAELQAWASGYTQRMNGLIAQQRQQRTAQNQESLEGLRASLSDGFDSGAGGGLASALADPPVVDLRHSRTLTPSLLRGPDAVPSLVREADGSRRATPASPDDLLKRREALQVRLKAMMAENGDLRTLGQRFYDLEAELTRIKSEAARLGSEGRDIRREMDLWGWWLDGAVQRNLERGGSLLMDVIVPKGTKSGLKTLEQNPKLWNKTLKSMAEYNDFFEFIGTVKDRYDAAGEAVDWVKAKHSLFQNVDFLASRADLVTDKLEAVSLHYKVGKSLLGASVDLAGELDGWGAILERQGDAALLLQKQKALQGRLDAVVRDLQVSRTQIAARLGVKPEELIPVQARPKGLGAVVPPL